MIFDHRETHGRHIISQFAALLPPLEKIADLGAGQGADILSVKKHHPNCHATAIDALAEHAADLAGRAECIEIIDIERDNLPFAEKSMDLIMANQVMEHTKEVFWIFDQVFRSLKVGGHFLVGVPNIASFHNRLLLLAGIHPTQHKLRSAHVRPFSRDDTKKFLQECFPGCSVVKFAGSQFYPFPSSLARVLANAFPTLAYSIFFLIRKDAEYHGEFLQYPLRKRLETNFWLGAKTDK